MNTVNTLSLTPLFRHTVGFDKFDQLFDRLLKNDEVAPSYPPYNIEKIGDDKYRIVMALAGFTTDDINIVSKEDVLTVSAKVAEKPEEQGKTYLHKGIAARSFERRFNLADYVKVADAELKDGLLTINLYREIPEEAKPRMIEIKNGVSSKTITGKKTN